VDQIYKFVSIREIRVSPSQRLRLSLNSKKTTLDNIIAIALAAHVGAWQVREDIETRAKRGNLETFDRILSRVPDVSPLPGDEL
jgi:hypothetical protein